MHPPTFLHAIKSLFQHSINRYCQVYLDDIIIFVPHVHQHIIELQNTLNVLQKAGLMLNPAKCLFAQLKVKYLGHWFSGEGYGMDPKIVDAVRGFKELKNARDCKAWLSLCGYYRMFCPGYSDIWAPIEKLTIQGVPFVWSSEAERAREILVEKLRSYQILRYLDVTRLALLYTDASSFSIVLYLDR